MLPAAALRLSAAAASVAVAVVYVLIATNVITVIDDQESAEPTPLFVAAAGFAALAVGLAVFGSRRVIVAGIVLTVLVLVGYLLVASEREPSFEAWGILLKVVQLSILVDLVLLWRASHPAH